MQLTTKAVAGSFVDVLGSRGIPFLAFLITARLISPEEFGSMTAALMIVGLLTVTLHQGLADALIYIDAPDERDISTAFWMNAALSLIIFLVLQLSAQPLASFFKASEMESLLRWLSALAPLQALGSVHEALFRRELATWVLARRTLTGRAIGGAFGVGFAFAGWGVWCLVILQLLQAAVAVVFMWLARGWRPQFLFDTQRAKILLAFGVRLIGGGLAGAVVASIDTLIVALAFDSRAVGVYALAARLLESLSAMVLLPVQSMILPVLSRMATHQEDFTATYEKMVRLAFSLWTPALILLGACAESLLPSLFGSKWMNAVPIVQGMSLAAFTTPLWFFAGQALAAAGRPDCLLRISIAQTIITLACMAAASFISLTAVAFASAATSALMVPVSSRLLRNGCKIRMHVLGPMLEFSVAGLIVLASSLVAQNVARDFMQADLMIAAIGTLVGLCVHVVILDTVLWPHKVSNALRSYLRRRGKEAPDLPKMHT